MSNTNLTPRGMHNRMLRSFNGDGNAPQLNKIAARKTQPLDGLFHKYILGISNPQEPITYMKVQKSYDETFNSNKFFAHLHCYDISKFNEIYDEYIEKISLFFKVVITFSIGDNNLESHIDARFVIIKIPNKGLDIGAKFCMVKYLNDHNISYEYILFLHSKTDVTQRRRYFTPLIDSFNQRFIDSIHEYDGYFPDIQWEIRGQHCVSISGTNYSFPERNLENTASLLAHFGCNKRTNRFVDGNVYILSKKIVDLLFRDVKIYNILNRPNDFDYNWVRKRYNLSGDIKTVYNYFKINNLPPRNHLFNDGYIEHAFERVVLNCINDEKYKVINYTIIKDFPIDAFKCDGGISPLNEVVKIDTTIPAYYGDDEAKHKQHIHYFRYLRNTSDILAKYNIQLSFTIVGSDGIQMQNEFNQYLRKNILDSYIEFDQCDIDYKNLSKSYNDYSNPIFKMLHYKCCKCFTESWQKDADIYCLAGSDDYIDVSFYIKAALKLDKGKKQLFGLNKRKNVTLLYTSNDISPLIQNNVILWNLDYRDHASDTEYAGGILCISQSVLKDRRNLLLSRISSMGTAYNEVILESLFANDGAYKETVEGCYSVNYKTGNNLTSSEMIIQTITNHSAGVFEKYDEYSEHAIFEKCSKFWNDLLSLSDT